MDSYVPIATAVTAVFAVIELGLTAYRKSPPPTATSTTLSTLTTL